MCPIAACATEVFKLATRLVNIHNVSHCCVYSCSTPMQNYMVFNDVDGIYTFTFEYEKKVRERDICMSLLNRMIV